MSLIRMTTVPKIVESYSGPEFFADGTIFLDRGEIVTMIHYVERYSGNNIKNIEVCRVHRARANWLRSLERANAMYRAGLGE